MSIKQDLAIFLNLHLYTAHKLERLQDARP